MENMFRPPIDRYVCPRCQAELGQNLCSVATWHLYVAHRVVLFFSCFSCRSAFDLCAISFIRREAGSKYCN